MKRTIALYEKPKTMTRLSLKKYLLWLALLGMAFTQAEGVTVDATLVLASNEPLPAEAKLGKIEKRLKRVFNFEHFQQMGTSSIEMMLPGEAMIALGHGYRLKVVAKKPKEGKSRALIQWFRGEELLMETSIKMGKGKPAVLGGPPHEGGNLILILRAR